MKYIKNAHWCKLATGALTAFAFSSMAFATSPEVPDRDADDDGLIEINSWADLNEMRNNTSGKLYGSNLGCPTAGCTGYELTTDLDFDTNGNGKFDANDTYWNNGAGWDPLATSNAVFEGNGHLIRNLIVNNQVDFGGLFGSVQHLHIRNLGLTGKLMSIEAIKYVGGFAGLMEGGSITGCFSTGRVTTEGQRAGGLVGVSQGTAFKAVFSSALVEGATFSAGLVGLADVDSNGTLSTIDSSYTVAKPPVIQRYRGLANGGGTVTNSYWARDAKGDSTIIDNLYYGETTSTLADLKCGLADDSSCVPYVCLKGLVCTTEVKATLYVGWGNVKDSKNNAYWDFGTKEQLPGLVLNGTLYRDSDGNGVLDSDEPTGSSSSSSTSSSSTSPASSLAGNVAPIIKVKAYWAIQVWDDWSRLDASETIDPNGDTLSFTWDFGDGKTAYGAVVSHTYYLVGTVMPRLTVDDGHGGVSTMSWTVLTVDSYASSKSSKSSSSSAQSSSAAAISSSPAVSSAASSTSSASSAPIASSSAFSTPSLANDDRASGGGGVNILMLLMLSGVGFAWRGKKVA